MASSTLDTPIAIISGLVNAKYSAVAAVTMYVWDYILTFDQEVTMVWNTRKSFGKTIFFCNRYIPPCVFVLDLTAQFIYSPSVKVCSYYQISSSILDQISVLMIEVVLIIRTHALYQQQWLVIGLGLLCFGSMLSMTTAFFVIFEQFETFLPASTLGVSGCHGGCTAKICQPLVTGIWIPFFLMETIVFVLTARKSFQDLWGTRHFSESPTVATVLFRDGLIYYIVIMAVSIFVFLISIFDPFSTYIALGLMKSLQATICSRLLLNIRGILSQPIQRNDESTSFHWNHPEESVAVNTITRL